MIPAAPRLGEGNRVRGKGHLTPRFGGALRVSTAVSVSDIACETLAVHRFPGRALSCCCLDEEKCQTAPGLPFREGTAGSPWLRVVSPQGFADGQTAGIQRVLGDPVCLCIAATRRRKMGIA